MSHKSRGTEIDLGLRRAAPCTGQSRKSFDGTLGIPGLAGQVRQTVLTHERRRRSSLQQDLDGCKGDIVQLWLTL